MLFELKSQSLKKSSVEPSQESDIATAAALLIKFKSESPAAPQLVSLDDQTLVALLERTHWKKGRKGGAKRILTNEATLQPSLPNVDKPVRSPSLSGGLHV